MVMDGKKLLVFSDTHGSISALKAVMNWAKDHIPPNDTICCAAFLGDGLSDLRKAANETGLYCDWKLVGGNNDYGTSAPEAAVFDFCDSRFFMCHGHRHSLYGGYHSLVAAARNSQANAALFGHTHVPFHKNIDGVELINPGSVGRPRSRIGASFAVIECAPNEPLTVEFLGIENHGQIKKLKIQS
jgi:putative phosphoesterase